MKQAFLSDFTGQTPRWGAFALTEPHAGSDMAAISTTAQKQKAGYVLNGTKAFIGNGTRAHWTVVIATINPKLGIFGLRPFLVRQGLPGFTVAKHLCSFGLRALAICELLFQECRIPEESLLQPDQHQGNQHGFAASQTVFRHFRPVVAALAIGTARASIEQVEELARQNGAAHTLAHESHRIRSRIDLMKMKLHAARLLCWRAAWLSDHGMVTALDISMAKLQGTKAARETCRECMEIAGRAAAGDTLILEKLFRDMSALELMEGTGEMHRLIIARGFPSDPTVEPAAKENRVTL